MKGIQRLYKSVKDNFFCIFVDGRFKNWEGAPLSDDGSRKWLIRQKNIALVAASDLIEFQKRNKYIELAKNLGFRWCLVLDSDEYVEYLDYEQFQKDLRGDAMRLVQNYDDAHHIPTQRLHSTQARHTDRHNQIWLNGQQLFTYENPIVKGIILKHDKTLRDPVREKYRVEYYQANPLR